MEITSPWYQGSTADFCLLVFLLIVSIIHMQESAHVELGLHPGPWDPCRGRA